MNPHLNNLLQAYHDDALSDRRGKQVEAHLLNCPECREELAGLQSLSDLFAADAPLETKARPEQFVAQVRLRLPVQQRLTFWQQTRRTLWYQVPVMLMLILAVVKTSAVINNLFLGIQAFGIGGEPVRNLMNASVPGVDVSAAVPLPSFQVPAFIEFALDQLSVGAYFGVSMTNMWVLPSVLALFYLSWMTGWWVLEERE